MSSGWVSGIEPLMLAGFEVSLYCFGTSGSAFGLVITNPLVAEIAWASGDA